jgi:integrase
VNPYEPLLDDYLAARRASGWKLRELERDNRAFLAWLDAEGRDGITAAGAVEWAMSSPKPSPNRWGARLASVRVFTAWLRASGAAGVEVPDRAELPVKPSRATPYMYSRSDIEAVAAAFDRVCATPIARATMPTLVGLLAVTGMRIGEALALVRADLDPAAGTLAIRADKTGQRRVIPVDPTTAAVEAFIAVPARRALPSGPAGPLFPSRPGRAWSRGAVEAHYQRAVAVAGLPDQSPARPRIHDFRYPNLGGIQTF